ncbi:uncharacterized protein Tco025E_05411 [Trypanosoma conorhini]|uniref:Uncharacterized protein n=1 Tax=Trypanosoma conorhini TaxID=83891 RepID=A0A3R7KUY2_9TRYP|nr:uncharacterized protein Tco025E_05411 [Trypanosoma conorhini]RNF15727.1 hypothetical protein Tco025E_05411 [Trypanosoma conorhini]
MLRVGCCFLGRWGPRDFLRGRTKRGGAIHTRHTHGSQGRYKRLSNSFGLRDGRRHAWNHMKGGLGVKLGGGLFGLRIPRQHALSTMSREQYEVSIHGHPNITNPYRHHMNEHPDLKGVMRNASLDVHVVLLMPRVPRATTNTTTTTTTAVAEEVPHAWDELLQHLGGVIQKESWALGHSSSTSGSSIKTYCATTSASVLCRDASHDSLHAAAASLFKDLTRGAKISPPSPALLRQRHEKRHIPLFGASFSTDALPYTRAGVALASSTSPFCTAQKQVSRIFSQDSKKGIDRASMNPPMSLATISSCGVSQRGVQQLLQDLQQACPQALGLCLRLEELLPAGGAEVQESAAEASSTSPPRKLLREEMDPDEVGVWKSPTATVGALMRWQYFNWDPRAHSKDCLPHHRRCQSVHVFVDASRVRGRKNPSAVEASSNQRRFAARSLMSPHLSEKLQSMNFKRVSQKGLAETLAALRGWSVDSHWRALEERRRTRRGEAKAHSHSH